VNLGCLDGIVTNQIGNAPNSTVGEININLLKDRVLYELSSTLPLPERDIFSGPSIFSISSAGRRRGEFMFSNVSINFYFNNSEIADYFFRIIDESLEIKKSILMWSGLVDYWNTQLGINGTNVYLTTSGLRNYPMEIVEENYSLVIKEGRAFLNIFREIMTQEEQNGSRSVKIVFVPELLNVTLLYKNQIIVRLTIPRKMEILTINSAPDVFQGDPERGFELTWNSVPEELNFSYIIDEVEPIISSIDCTPERVTFEDSPNIIIKASDTGVGLKNVTLKFSINGGVTWEEIQCVQIAGDAHEGLFKAVIPKQPYGTSVAYRIEIADRAGNVARSNVLSYKVELPFWVYGIVTIIIIIAIAIITIMLRRRRTYPPPPPP
jgi:hypothetical protein